MAEIDLVFSLLTGLTGGQTVILHGTRHSPPRKNPPLPPSQETPDLITEEP